MLDLSLTPTEIAQVHAIAQRAFDLGMFDGAYVTDRRGRKHAVTRADIAMNIAATHKNGCPLMLRELLDGRDCDFVHDVAGIHKHLDRDTGILGDCFWPRFAQPERKPAAVA